MGPPFHPPTTTQTHTKTQTINSQKPKSLHTTKTLTLAKVGFAKVGFGQSRFRPCFHVIIVGISSIFLITCVLQIFCRRLWLSFQPSIVFLKRVPDSGVEHSRYSIHFNQTLSCLVHEVSIGAFYSGQFRLRPSSISAWASSTSARCNSGQFWLAPFERAGQSI